MTDDVTKISTQQYAKNISSVVENHLREPIGKALESGTHPAIVIYAMFEAIGQLMTLKHGDDQVAAQDEFEKMAAVHLADWRASPYPDD